MDGFPTMGDGHLARVAAAKHRIDLTEPENTPIHQNPYRGGAQHLKFERIETQKLLAARIIEQPNTK